MVDLMESWMEVGNEDETIFSRWMRKSFNGNENGELNRIIIHIYLFKLLDIYVTVLIVIFMFQ